MHGNWYVGVLQEYDVLSGLARGGIAGVGLELTGSPPSSSPSSVLVTGVVEGSPAEKAGVLAGDVLAAVDGEEVTYNFFSQNRFIFVLFVPSTA